MSETCGTGDQGQRYEHTCEDSDGFVIVFGWSDGPDAFKNAIELNPSYFNHKVTDREETDNE